MSRVFAIVINPETENEKFEILSANFLPEENTVIVLRQGDRVIKASVVKVESVLDRVGDSADLTFNIFMKILPEEENVN